MSCDIKQGCICENDHQKVRFCKQHEVMLFFKDNIIYLEIKEGDTCNYLQCDLTKTYLPQLMKDELESAI
jgi:hypothetical protein